MRLAVSVILSVGFILSAAGTALAADGGTACGTEGYIGCCEGNVVKRCINGQLVTKTCVGKDSGASYPACGWYNGKYDCTDAERSDPTNTYQRLCTQANNTDTPCGAIPYEGCCDGTKAKFCPLYNNKTTNALVTRDCVAESTQMGTSNNKCGWKTSGNSGYYTCGTSEGTDPSNSFMRSCNVVLDGGNPPRPDAGPKAEAGATGDSCGNIGVKGCCEDDNTVKYCTTAGKLGSKTCKKDGGSAGVCGWNTTSNSYGCGESTDEDSTGAYPRLCSAIGTGSGSGTTVGTGSGTTTKKDGGISAKVTEDDGCGCSLNAANGMGAFGGLLLLAALALLTRRGRGRL